MKLQNDGIINVVKSTPIVTGLKNDGVTPRICGDYQMTVTKVLNIIHAQQEKQKTY